MRILICIVSGLCLGACFEKKSLPADSGLFMPSRTLAELKNRKLEEVSGMAASVINPGLLWVHNDSGNPAVIYLVDQNLNIRLSCRLKGIKNRDWEDIAVGPGPEENKRYVYIADIGDNNARFTEKHIYRFEEPQADGKRSEIVISSFDTIAFRLPDGKKDTEAIWVHPRTRYIYVVSKREKPVHVYELKYPFPDTLFTAGILTTLPLTQIVAADMSPDGNELLMKNYDNVYYWDLKEKPLAEALKEKPKVLRYTEEPQGEAIAFSLGAAGYFTLSEKLRGEKTFLYFYARASP